MHAMIKSHIVLIYAEQLITMSVNNEIVDISDDILYYIYRIYILCKI